MRIPLRGTRRGVAVAGVLCAALGLVAAPAGAAGVPAVPNLVWRPCDAGFFCATATVPLDYANPTGATIQLAVIKRPATDPAHRIGSVFFNPGGPGGAGTSELPLLYGQFPPAVRARFDLVSWDPRGVGQSDPVQCFDSAATEQQLTSPALSLGYPTTAAQETLWENTFAAFDQACAAYAGPILAHDTTADNARDLDLLRQAVGDRALNYLGVSYGTYLGATYANLFPGKVRAITLDGDIDPVRWATGTGGSARMFNTYLRLDDDQASAATLNAFLDLCGRAATSSCAFSAGSPATTHAKWHTLLDRLAGHSVTVPGLPAFTPSFTASITLGDLYHALPGPGSAGGWSDLANLLQNLWTQAGGGDAPHRIAVPANDPAMSGRDAAPGTGTPYAGQESLYAVTCSDSPNPRDPAGYVAQAAIASARSGVLGPTWTWLSEACARWPVLAPQRYTGPWNRPTAAPILVVGNRFDPATPYVGAVAMARELADARLVTVNGYGHTELSNPSSCVGAIEDAYFVKGALPARGTVCQQDQAPFGG